MQNQQQNRQVLVGAMPENIPFRRELHSNDLERMKIPQRYWNASLDNIEDSEILSNGITFREVVKHYMMNITSIRREGAGYIFWGSNGTGKSCASVVIAKEFRRRGNTVLFMEAADLKRMVIEHEYFDEVETFWDRARSVDVLILDDFGKGIMDSTGFGVSLFDELIRARNSRKMVTIITSNLSVEDWREELELKVSTIHALKECTVPIQVVGVNKREVSAKRLRSLLS